MATQTDDSIKARPLLSMYMDVCTESAVLGHLLWQGPCQFWPLRMAGLFQVRLSQFPSLPLQAPAFSFFLSFYQTIATPSTTTLAGVGGST